MSGSADKTVDARGLEAPQPMMLVIEALDELAAGETLTLVIDREPYPLYRMLANNGYTHTTEMTDDGIFHVRIRHA